MVPRLSTLLALATTLLVGAATRANPADTGCIVLPESGASLAIMKAGAPYLSLQPAGWGANWKWIEFDKRSVNRDQDDGILSATGLVRPSKTPLTVQMRMRQTGPSALHCEVNASVTSRVDTLLAVLSLNIDRPLMAGGKVELRFSGGSSRSFPFPWGRTLGDHQTNTVEALTLTDGKGATTTVRLTPPVKVGSDGAIRITLAESNLTPEAPARLALDITLPAPATVYPDQASIPQEPGFDAWYTFIPGTNHLAPSVIGLADWLDAPAGTKGRITMKEGKLYLAGEEIKLWGLNLCYAHCCPDAPLADQRAALYAKYGVNTVRLHKFADGCEWRGICLSNDFTRFDARSLDRFDYLVAQLKQRGIYVEFSPNFGVTVAPLNRDAVPYWAELGDAQTPLWKVGGGASQFFGREIGDLQIAQTLNILRHRNPYTGLTYAEDPAVYCLEMANEDDAFWGSTLRTLKQSATLRARAGAGFAAWLEAKYHDKAALLTAWGSKALNSFAGEGFGDESWEQKRIYPAGNPWFFDPENLAGVMSFQRQRLLDTMEYLYQLQNQYYERYRKALREAGYEGLTLASNWQAGSGASHYYNLHTDYQFGLIDRHNYFGGGSQTAIDASSMLSAAGSGMLSSGLQQVSDRPFMMSEWVHTRPNEWGVEGPAIMGAYGMGLQGWDVSYMFQNRDEGRMGTNLLRDEWQVVKPNHLGLFPAVARQVLRGDVKESDLLIPRYVHIPSLRENKLGLQERTVQNGDTKSFDSQEVPVKALAAGRCVVDFTSQYRITPTFDLAPFQSNGVITASTHQLQWHEGHSRADGFITLDTEGTEAVIGFAEGRRCPLGHATLQMKSRFGALYLSATGRREKLNTARHLLITAIARVRHSGMKIFADTYILEEGRPPLVMEPVKATIVLLRPDKATVNILDHEGFRTGRTLPIDKGVIEIDTGRDKTPYYEVAYE